MFDGSIPLQVAWSKLVANLLTFGAIPHAKAWNQIVVCCRKDKFYKSPNMNVAIRGNLGHSEGREFRCRSGVHGGSPTETILEKQYVVLTFFHR